MNLVELDMHRTAYAERQGREAWVEELRRSRQYLAEAQKLTHTGSWAWSPVSGDLLYWSEECYRILGFDPARGLPSFEASTERIHPEDRAETLAKIDQHARAGKDFEIEYRLLLPEGAIRNVRIFAHPVRDASGAVVEFIGTVVDVTEQKRAEEERREHRLEARLQETLDRIPAYTFYAAPNGALTFVNKRCADYLGLPEDHPLRLGIETGAPWDAHIPLLHPDDQDESRRIWAELIATGSPGEKSFRVRNAQGTYRWFLSRAEPLRAKDGTLLYWVGINLDIEELKQAELYLAEAQRLAHMGSWAFNGAGFEYWSAELFEIHGLKPGARAPSIPEYVALVHPEDRESVAREIRKMLAGAEGFDFTKRIVRPDGAIRHVRCVGIRATTGRIVQEFVGTGMDVTGHELLTQELRRREAYLAEAQRLSHTGSFGWKADTGEIIWSAETYRIFEYDAAVTPTIDLVAQRVHPEDRADFQSVIERASGGAREFEHAYRLLLPDGRAKHVHALAHAIEDASGNREFVGAVSDITERKRAEDERREHLWFLESMDRVNRAMQRSNDVELMTSGVMQEALEIFACDRACLIYPCDPDTPSYRTLMEHTSPEYGGVLTLGQDRPLRPEWAEVMRRALDHAEAVVDPSVPSERRERCRIASMLAIAVRPKGDRPYLFVVHCARSRPWTAAELRLFEEAAGRLGDALTSVLAHRNLLASQEALQVSSRDLQESKAKLEEAQRLTHVGYWEVDISTGRVNWSDETYRIYGMQPQERPMDMAAVEEKIHPEDWRRAAEAAFGGTRFEAECRLYRPTGEMRVAQFQGDTRRDAAGAPYQIFGTVQDITDRKRAEEERREHLWFLESMDRISRAMQRTNDVEGMMSGVLEEVLAIFGCDRTWLVYPCDPDAPTVRAVMEHTTPEYPGIFALGEELPVDAVGSEVLRRVLHAPGAVENPVMPPGISERFSIRSMIAIAVRPKGDRPYLFGLTQCSRPRTWSADERRLFEETARRLEDALTSVLAHRNLLASREELRASEQRFRTFVDQATDAFFLYDDKHVVRDVNRQACETTGYTREELIGMHVSRLAADFTPERIESLWGRLLEHGTMTYNGLLRRKDASVSPIEVRARVFNRGGRLVAIALAIDITERRRRERCLLAQHGVTQALSEEVSLEAARPRILRAIGEALKCDFGVMWCLDPQAGVLRCTATWLPADAALSDFEAAMRASSFGPGMDLPGRAWSTGTAECVRDLAADPSSARAGLAANAGLHAAFAFPVVPKSGIAGVIEFFSREVLGPDPELLQMMATVGPQVGQFIERTRAEDALRTARSELAHVTRVMSMGQLTASIAHEVNQPLGAMVTSAASAMRWLAADPPNLPKASLALARIAVDGERAGAVIDRVRRLVKRQEPGREPIDVNETIRSVVALMRDELERAGVAHAERLADNLPAILGDRVLLQQVILNLILNAIDAMRGIEDRARVLRIESRLDDAGEVRVQVRDTGRGLPPDARLFEAFYTTKERGLGMGLSISQSIVEAHGGRMQARANESHGAIFEFSLPLPQV